MSGRVVIAGGGIAGLEAMLQLHRLAPDAVDVTLLDPAAEFVYKPMLVAEPFGTGEAGCVDLGRAAAGAAATHVRSGLAAVDAKAHRATTEAGKSLEFDDLLVAVGVRPVQAVPGAVTFGDERGRARFGDLLEALGRRGAQRIAFVVPPLVHWSIAAYELALLTAGERDTRNLTGVELTVLTHEHEPLAPLGPHASGVVRTRLEKAAIGLRTDVRALEFARHEVRLENQAPFSADAAVALPALEAPLISGLPRDEHGFLPTDELMRVRDAPGVWAAGDIVAGSIKQGGVAAQHADVAARAIAAEIGVPVGVRPFKPVLRAALLTGDVPDFFRATDVGTDTATGEALWSPTGKVAAEQVAPFLAETLGGLGVTPGLFEDCPAPTDPDASARTSREAIRLLLAAADGDAQAGDFEGALGWLGVVEQLDLAIPAAYVTRRDEWRRHFDPSLAIDPAAGRIDPSRRGMDLALSDLERRIGWLRQMEARGVADMTARLRAFDEGMEQLADLSRRTGLLD